MRNDWYRPWGESGTEKTQAEPINSVKVIGPCTADGRITVWHFPDRGMAEKFAEGLAKDVCESVLVVDILCRYRPEIPVVRQDVKE